MRRGLGLRLSRKTEGLDEWLAGGLGNRLESNQRNHDFYNGHLHTLHGMVLRHFSP